MVRLNVVMIGASYDGLNARGIPDYFTVMRALSARFIISEFAIRSLSAITTRPVNDIDTIGTCPAHESSNE